ASPERFTRFYRNTAVPDDTELTPKRARDILQQALWDAYNITPNQFAAHWRHLLNEAEPMYVRELRDREAIRNLFAVRDRGVEEGDPAMFRSTMEGFYCNGADADAKRATFAETMTMTPHAVRSRVRAIYDGDIKNYPRAYVVFELTAYGHTRREQAVVERY